MMVKNLIYKPKGKNLEYSGEDAFALNIYKKCHFACTYCYNRLRNENFFSNTIISKEDRFSFITKLEKELPNYKGKKIFLSFGSDPFPPIEATYNLTSAVLELFLKYNISPIILTKGLIPPLAMFRLGSFKYQNPSIPIKIGTTFVTTVESEFEPFAPSFENRLWQLNNLKNTLGHLSETWVSLEPVIYPDQTLLIIKETYKFVDHYKIGTWNYDPRSATIDWKKFGKDVVELLDSLGKSYTLKKTLIAKLK